MNAPTVTVPNIDDDALQAFAMQLRGPVLTPEDPSYEEARLIWNGLIDRRPAIIAQCSGAADVVDAVNFAREHDLLVSVRGGGHNVAGNAVNESGLVIDLSLMRGVHVDPATRVVRVQAGATLGDVDRETQLFGLAVPAGVVSTTGCRGPDPARGCRSSAPEARPHDRQPSVSRHRDARRRTTPRKCEGE